MSKLIKTIKVCTDCGDYGENIYVFDKNNELINFFSMNDLVYSEYLIGLLKSLGHDVERPELINIFGTEEALKAFYIDQFGYDANADETEEDYSDEQ